MQKAFEAKIQALILDNKNKIGILLGQFKNDLNQVQGQFQNCKTQAASNKQTKDQQLVLLDEEHENEVDEMKMKHKDTVFTLE